MFGVNVSYKNFTTSGSAEFTVAGKKMSKSRGTFFTAKEFREMYHPEALRFFYASHLDQKVIDVVPTL